MKNGSTTKQASGNSIHGGLKAVLNHNENVKPNSGLLNTLKSALPEFFEKDTVDEEGNITRHGAFKSDKFLEEIKANNIAEARDGYKLGFVGKDYARLQTGLRSETMIVPDSKHNALPANKDSGNIFITGDNIDALRHLVNAYENQIKLIYIDPPYNTGNKDFVYSDTFEYKDEKLQSVLGYTDTEIARLKSIQGKSSHSAWLAFMYPRLKIAQKLLTSDGVIFVSIDDNEQANLKLLMDEVFGEGNFFAQISWHKNYASANDSKQFSNVLDYILVYQKTCAFVRNLLPRTCKQNDLYKYDSKDGKGLWRSDNLSVKTYSANYDYPITNPNTGAIYNPPKGRCWLTNYETIQKWIKENRIFFGQKGDGAPQLKRYLNEVQGGIVPLTYWSYDECGHNDEARKELKDIFETPPFNTPKPTRLIKQILQIATTPNSNDLILDFFAGSSTTAHAVMQLNAEDGDNRKFIMVQWAEQTSEDSEARKAGYKTIDQISRERIKRAGAKILKDYTEKETSTTGGGGGGLPFTDEQIQSKWDKDIGFKHYRLITPDVKTLDKIETFDPSAPLLIAEDMIAPFANPATETSGIETLLTTWLIDDGFTFDTALETVEFAGYAAHLVQSKLYLIAPDWGSKQTKDLLNRIGKNELNVQHIVIYAYSFLMESLRELEINIKNTLDADHRVYVERRY